jgi:hypothetical protein
MRTNIVVLVVVVVITGAGFANGATVVADVPGTDAIWLAGQPNGTSIYGDVAPDNSPVAVNVAGLAGESISFSTTGTTSIGFDPVRFPVVGADGATESLWPTELGHVINTAQPNFGLSGFTAPSCSLLGVFLDSYHSQSTPPSLDFSIPGSTSFSQLSPQLQQIFFIGDGLTGTGNGNQQLFQIPPGADTLYLATMDVNNHDNIGSLEVTVNGVPEPSTLALLASGAIGLLGWVWRRKRAG